MDQTVSSVGLPSHHHHSAQPRFKNHPILTASETFRTPPYLSTTMSAHHDNDMDKKVASTHIEDAVHHEDYKTYAEDPLRGPVTVLDTMGQDPDHRPHIPWTAWVILALCALAQFQNVFFG